MTESQYRNMGDRIACLSHNMAQLEIKIDTIEHYQKELAKLGNSMEKLEKRIKKLNGENNSMYRTGGD